MAAADTRKVKTLLRQLDGKSESSQRPIIDQLVAIGPKAVDSLSDLVENGETFQIRMASATALG
ncbi:MAG: hypothetical protein CO095_14465, partial [Armatimonadetes bacterium CG_4_9_14_3_um_filter_58_7]